MSSENMKLCFVYDISTPVSLYYLYEIAVFSFYNIRNKKKGK